VPVHELVILILVGFSAGVLGGLLGIGGSIIMIPVLTVILHKSQHLAQAAAMIVNIFVSLPSAWHHHSKAGAVRWDVVWRMLPAGIIGIVIGVMISDLFHGNQEQWLTMIFGVFLFWVVAINILHIYQRRPEPESHHALPTWLRCSAVGGSTGIVGGLLGIGGGVVMVPLLQRITKLPFRQCIGTSSAVMCVTALFGAFSKNWTLAEHIDALGRPLQWSDSLFIAGCLAPTAVVGGLIGAKMTHTLHLKWVRVAFLVLLTMAAARMVLRPLLDRSEDATAKPASVETE
jgi:uncharacterized membrane protein YfcA